MQEIEFYIHRIRYENYDLDKEYTDSIKMKKSDLLFDYNETDEFEN